MAGVAVHDHRDIDAVGDPTGDFEALAELARAPEVIAIGETGLDYYRRHTSPGRQREALDWHLGLADELTLPVIVHNRQAETDVATLAGDHTARGVLHCFSSTDAHYLERMLALGYNAGPGSMKSFAGGATPGPVAQSYLDRLHANWDAAAEALR